MKRNDRIELFVPGRLCLFGEHSDWAGTYRMVNADIVPGRAIVTGTEQGIYAFAEKADGFAIDYVNDVPGEPFECPMDVELLRAEAQRGGYDSYVAGVASYMCEWYHVGGVRITVTKRDLPQKKGVSSSAAICVLVAQAFDRLYDLKLSTQGIMNIAYNGEQRTPSRCGRLDQACAFGSVPVSMTFDGNEIHVDRLTVKKTLHYVFADLNRTKDTVRILADLNRAYPFARTQADRGLQSLLGGDNLDITTRAARYISEGEVGKLGALMTEAQRLFDEKACPMCPEELGAPVLHAVLADEKVRALTYGGKGVGSQGDGMVQFLAKDRTSQEALVAYLDTLGMTPYTLTLRSSNVIRKAIIPLAGFGTRMYPETRFIRKEFCPVVDSDGMAKPGLLILLEELDSVGIEKIDLIISPADRQLYEELLLRPISAEHYAKLPLRMQEYENRLRRIARKIEFSFQEEAKGFGHAVYQAARFADRDPVLLLLGDTIYESDAAEPCTKQLMDAYELYGRTTVGLCEIPVERSGSYGVFSGTWEDTALTAMRCVNIAEKPNAEYAREYLTMPAGAANKLYGAFGVYALAPELFDRLSYAIENGIVSARGEVELTDALAWLAEHDTVMGKVLNGRSYDLGNPEAYRRAVTEFGRQI